MTVQDEAPAGSRPISRQLARLRRRTGGGQSRLRKAEAHLLRQLQHQESLLMQVRDSEDRLRLIVESSPIGVVLTDVNGRIVRVNQAFATLTGRSSAELVGTAMKDLLDDGGPFELGGLMALALGEVPVIEARHQLSVADGTRTSVATKTVAGRHEHGPAELFVSQVIDLSEREQAEDRMAHLAMHDALTGLPNRSLLQDRLEKALARSVRSGQMTAVLFADLDRFKIANDSLGHDVGDAILVEIAGRLNAVVREGDTVARFGGDEFVIVCEDIDDPVEAEVVAARLRTALNAPVAAGRQEVSLSVSIGIATSDGDDEPTTLIRNADAAMYQAKEAGRDGWAVFDDRLRAKAVERLDLEQGLKRAAERHELCLAFQPQVSFADGRLCGVEALVRWRHPTRGTLLPADFLDVAEETGSIVSIGEWVLEEAVRQAAEWGAGRPGGLVDSVSVNLSPAQLLHRDLPQHVALLLERHDLPSSALAVEITESMVLHDVAAVVGILSRLGEMGIDVGIDDFGTGYSAMSYLKSLPVSFLKIDRSFVTGLGTDPGDAAIASTIIQLGHSFGLRVVAEGVESRTQAKMLAGMRCDAGQGFLYAPPRSAKEIELIFNRDRALHPRTDRTVVDLGGDGATDRVDPLDLSDEVERLSVSPPAA